MKKIIKTTMLTLSMLIILNMGAKTISAKNINNQPQNTVEIESRVASTNNVIDPDSERS